MSEGHHLVVIQFEYAGEDDDHERDEDCSPKSQRHCDDTTWDRLSIHVTVSHSGQRDHSQPNRIKVIKIFSEMAVIWQLSNTYQVGCDEYCTKENC